MFRGRSFNILLLCILIALGTSILKYLFPHIAFLMAGYIAVVLLTLFLRGGISTKIFGAIGIFFIIIFAFYPHDGMTRQQVITQHLISGVILIIAIVAILYVKVLYGSIEHEQQQVRSMFEFATEGIVLTDKNGKITLINPAALRLFHYKREELIGATVETLIPTRFQDRHQKYREGFYQSPSNRTMGHGRDLYAKTKEGEEFPVEVSLSYYKNRNEFYVIAFIVDITQRKEAERRTLEQKEQLEKITSDIRKLNAELENKVEQRTVILREALEELERSKKELSESLDKEKELSEIKSRFVSMASHEFRTPLSTVLSSAALIGKYTQAEEQDKRDKHIKRIKDSVKHLNDLLEDFLSLGKLEEGKVTVSADQFELNDFLQEVGEEMKGTCKTGQQISISYDGDGFFSTDKKLLRNIIINLLSNAIKFSPEQSTIWLSAWRRENELFMTVKDEGIGIASNDLPYMFTSFYRGSNAVNIQGTGLGLHIVKRYVDLIMGEIGIESELEKGTTITLKLPVLDN